MKEQIPVDLKNIKNIRHFNNNTHFVYFLCDGDEIVYVGQTYSLSFRIKNHQKDKFFTEVYYLDNLIKEEAISIEDHYIKHLQPKYNKRRSKIIAINKNKQKLKYVDTSNFKTNPIYEYLKANNITYQKAAELTGLTKQAIWIHATGVGRMSERVSKIYNKIFGMDLKCH